MNEPFPSPAELAPPVPEGLTPQQCIAVWAEWMDVCEQFLLAGLRREIGPGGDLKAAYRRWYAEHMEEHDRTMRGMVEQFNRRAGGGDAG